MGRSGAGVPELDGAIVTGRRDGLAVGAVSHADDGMAMPVQRDCLGVAQAVEIVPLEAAEVGLARRRAGLFELAQHLGDIGVAPVALGQVECRRVGQVPGDVLAFEGLVPRRDGRRPSPGQAGDPEDRADHRRAGERGDQLAPPHPLHRALDPRGGPGEDRPAVEPSVQIVGQLAGRRSIGPVAPCSGTSGR